MLSSVQSSVPYWYNPFGDTCYDGVAFAAFSHWVSVVLVYTLVYHMMEPPSEYYEVVEERSEIEELPNLPAGNDLTLFNPSRSDISDVESIRDEILISPESYSSDAPLDFIADSMAIISKEIVPAVMLVLGGMLWEGPDESRLRVRTTIGIVVARLLILPLGGIVSFMWLTNGIV
ncbi:hypothetical protein F3Y22_tig00111810pilonHSYRG00162 [Hibiscus syriacus]|uniref:Uncharacterized protein n=1 Tax=Hibiscus syriacus TaxID=106335 RepID=A0A6A2XBX7_HIBSY|nr:hypothetical protein F3Y22_tig00111810pilonHSYRG00162 [Hibiscus syriacus]